MSERVAERVATCAIGALLGALILAIGMLQGDYQAMKRTRLAWRETFKVCTASQPTAGTPACRAFLDMFGRLYGGVGLP